MIYVLFEVVHQVRRDLARDLTGRAKTLGNVRRRLRRNHTGVDEDTGHTRGFERGTVNTPRPKKAGLVKGILIIVFDMKGSVNREFVLPGTGLWRFVATVCKCAKTSP
jgi:hypothetical protein